MRFYNQQHKYYCGIDLHARSMYICVVPTRQGVHLPHDSMAQNSMAKRACCAMSTVSSNTTMPP